MCSRRPRRMGPRTWRKRTRWTCRRPSPCPSVRPPRRLGSSFFATDRFVVPPTLISNMTVCIFLLLDMVRAPAVPLGQLATGTTRVRYCNSYMRAAAPPEPAEEEHALDMVDISVKWGKEMISVSLFVVHPPFRRCKISIGSSWAGTPTYVHRGNQTRSTRHAQTRGVCVLPAPCQSWGAFAGGSQTAPTGAHPLQFGALNIHFNGI